MATHKWTDIKARMTTDAREKLAADHEKDVIEYTLRQLRDASGLTQVQLADRLESAQSGVARMESGTDAKLSTLRRYVHALGGEVDIIARVNGKEIKLAV